MTARAASWLGILGAVSACGAPGGEPDAARIDAARIDATLQVDASDPDAEVPDAEAPDAEPLDAGPRADAEPPDAFVCAPPLMPLDDGSSAARRALVISEINPGDYLELFNTTGSPISLGASSYFLASPHDYCGVAQLASGITVPAGGYATIPWPSPASGCFASFSDTDAGGEILLYLDSIFSVDDHIMDFVCWGTNPHFSRQGQAVATGKWSSATACAPALAGGAIHRVAGTDGVDPGDYDTTSPPSPMSCTP